MCSESYQPDESNGRERIRIVVLRDEIDAIDDTLFELAKRTKRLTDYKATLELAVGEFMDEFRASLRQLCYPDDKRKNATIHPSRPG